MGLIKQDTTALPSNLSSKVFKEVAESAQQEIKHCSGLSSLDKRIMAQGTIQAAMQSQAVFSHSTNFEEWWNLVEVTAKRAIKFIEENSTC